MNEQQQINKIQKSFGKSLITLGIKFLNSAFHLSPKIFTRQQISNFLTQLKLTSLSLADENYYIIAWNDWLNLIQYDWTEEHPYYADKFDCDNFSGYFTANNAYVYDLNSDATCFGQIFNKNTGVLVGNHAFNLIIATENNQLVAYLFEPMTGKYVKYSTNTESNIIDNWRYVINWVFAY